MLLTKKLLIQWNACEEGIAFCERNKLFGVDLSRLDEIQGDYKNFIYKSDYTVDSKGQMH